jgi:RNA polymerase sigma-70 factor (ECF subfamily)
MSRRLGEPDRVRHSDLTVDVLAANYLTRVHRFAVMVSPRDVDPEDIAQAALLKALEHADQFDANRGTLDMWLWRIVVNVAHDAGRLAKRTDILRERLAAYRPNPEASADTLALDRIRDQDLIAAVRALPRRYRMFIAFRYGAGSRSGEVADLLGTTRMAVVKGTRRALDQLRIELRAHESEGKEWP